MGKQYTQSEADGYCDGSTTYNEKMVKACSGNAKNSDKEVANYALKGVSGKFMENLES